MLLCLFSTTESEKKKKEINPEKGRVPQKAFKPQGCPRKSCRKLFPLQTGPWQGSSGCALSTRRRVLAENTYWAEPTLLSLLPSTLAGFVSSTSCCSSVIGAAAGGHLQTSARLPSAPARPPPSGCHRPGRRPSEPRGASRPGQGCGPPTWTRLSDRDWSERAWKNPRGRGGEGRVEAK